MIKVEVVLYASLSKYHPEKAGSASFFLEVPEGSQAKWLIEHLGIPEKELKQMFIRNRRTDIDHILQDGDRVAIFPPVGGG
jgi:molybdopterin converting factor small subunit